MKKFDGPFLSRRNVINLFFLVVMVIATVLLLFLITKRDDDEAARNLIIIEEKNLQEALSIYELAITKENVITRDKEIAADLTSQYSDLKVVVNITGVLVDSVDDLNVVTTSVNDTISTLNDGYSSQIMILEEMFFTLLSKSNETSVLIKSGNCMFSGVTSTSIDYEYRVVTVNTLEYFYYIFKPTTDITIDNTGIMIHTCTPLIYETTTTGTERGIFQKQLDRFAGDGVTVLSSIETQQNKVVLNTNTFAGTKLLRVQNDITQFTSFF